MLTVSEGTEFTQNKRDFIIRRCARRLVLVRGGLDFCSCEFSDNPLYFGKRGFVHAHMIDSAVFRPNEHVKDEKWEGRVCRKPASY